MTYPAKTATRVCGRVTDTIRVAWRRRKGLRRFHEAQDPIYHAVVDELLEGRKESHWMWFIFPQPVGLGRSVNSRVYALTMREAQDYLRDPVLYARLRACVALVWQHVREGTPLEAIFGELDAMKFRSCVDLFADAEEMLDARPSDALY